MTEISKPLDVVVLVPPGTTEVLVRGLHGLVDDVTADVKLETADRVWTPVTLRGGELKVRGDGGSGYTQLRHDVAGDDPGEAEQPEDIDDEEARDEPTE